MPVPLPTLSLAPKPTPSALSLPEFAEPPPALKLGLNLLPAEAAPITEVAPALKLAPAPTLELAPAELVATPIALALGITLATPEATANEDVILQKLHRDEQLLYPSHAPLLLEQANLPFYGGQDSVRYKVSIKSVNFAFSEKYRTQFLIDDFWGPIGGVRNVPELENGYRIEILSHGRANNARAENASWISVASITANRDTAFPPEISSIVRLDGLPDSKENLPLAQGTYSLPEQTLASERLQRQVGDRPIPQPALRLQPAAKAQKLSLPEFAEPSPALKLGLNLKPVEEAAPHLLSLNPSLRPATNALMKPVPHGQVFLANIKTRAPEPEPIALLIPLPAIEPKPQATALEIIESQTKAEFLKEAIRQAICEALADPEDCLTKKLSEIEDNCYAAVPDSWQIRPEGARPQLIIQFGEDLGNGKIGPPKYPLTIPHTFTQKLSVCPIPRYKKGSWEVILVLSDNSKVTVNAFDELEANKVLVAAQKLILPKYLLNSYSKGGKIRKGEKLAEIVVVPKMAKYFSTGQKNLKPDWIVRFR